MGKKRPQLALRTLIAVMSCQLLFAQETIPQLDPAKVIGVPFLDPAQIKLKTEAEASSEIFARMREFQGWDGYEWYQSLKKNKAVAIQYGGCTDDPFVPYLYRQNYMSPWILYWGGAWEDDSIEGARKEALSECQKSFQSGAKEECTLFLENDDPEPRTQMIKRMVEDCRQTQIKWLHEAKTAFEHSQFTLLLAQASRELKSDGKKLPFRVARRIGPSVVVGYPDSIQDYASACWDHVFYALIPVKTPQREAVRALLGRLGESSYFGQYTRTVNTTLDYRDPKKGTEPLYPGGPYQLTNQMAHFVEHGRIDSSNTPKFPQNLKDALAGEKILEVWLEGAARISKSGLPLSVEGDEAPLAIQTDKSLYLGVEVRLPPEKGGCNVSYPLKGEVLDYSICKGNATCKENAVNTVLQSASAALQASPISSNPMLDEPLGPGEVSLQRAYQPSLVLGRPFYELSTYSIHTYTASSDHPMGDAYEKTSYMGTGGRGIAADSGPLLLFMYVEHVLTCTPNKNGIYSEPEDAQVKEYDLAIQNALLGGIKNACTTLRGKMKGSVCVMQ